MDESFVVGGPVGDSELLLCHGMVCVVGRIRDLILQLSKSSIYSTKPARITSSSQRFIHPYFDEFYDKNDSYFLKLITIETDDAILVNFDFTANPRLANPSVRSVINWHIQELEITIDNADMFRKDFEYYINKTRKKNLQNNQEIQDFINEEMSYEREFSWRGVMLNSLSSDQENFRIFIELVYSVKYILNVE